MNKRKRKKAEKKKWLKLAPQIIAAVKEATDRPLPAGVKFWTPETGWIET